MKTAAIEILARQIDDTLGTCPLDKYDWQRPEGCDVICGSELCGDDTNPFWRCWVKWAEEQR